MPVLAATGNGRRSALSRPKAGARAPSSDRKIRQERHRARREEAPRSELGRGGEPLASGCRARAHEAERLDHSAPGEAPVGARELPERHVAVPEHQAGPVVLGAGLERVEARLPQHLQHSLRAEGVGQLDRRNVVAVGEGGPEPHRPVLPAVVVPGEPRTAGGLHLQVHVAQHRGRGPAAAREREAVGEGLERAARLAASTDPVVLALVGVVPEVRRADIGQNVARGVVDDEHRRLAEARVGGELRAHRPLDVTLERRVERGPDLHRAAEPDRLQLSGEVHHQMWRAERAGGRDEVQVRGRGDPRQLPVEPSCPEHTSEHLAHRPRHPLGIPPRVHPGRGAGDGGEERGLPHRERAGLVDRSRPARRPLHRPGRARARPGPGRRGGCRPARGAP